MRTWLSICLASLVFAVHAQASATATTLERALAPYQAFSSRFEQTVRDSRGEIISALSGELAVQGETQFRWQSLPPFSQLIVADGEVLWTYDEDLMQVQVRPLQEALQASPAAVLGGSAATLDLRFEMTRVESDDLERFVLVPRAKDEVTESIAVVFSQSQLRELVIQDALGQTTTLTFFDLDLQTPDASQFEFTPPPDADVIYALNAAPPSQ